jgi:hypothetical protein
MCDATARIRQEGKRRYGYKKWQILLCCEWVTSKRVCDLTRHVVNTWGINVGSRNVGQFSFLGHVSDNVVICLVCISSRGDCYENHKQQAKRKHEHIGRISPWWRGCVRVSFNASADTFLLLIETTKQW